MHLRTRIFVDYWNFQIEWNDRTGKARVDWSALPQVLVRESEKLIRGVSGADSLDLEETLVFASVKSPDATNHKVWFESTLNRLPGYRVTIRERKLRAKGVFCGECRTKTDDCPNCERPLKRAPEKGIDTAIAIELLYLAWEGAYDVAILLSSDGDLVPAVERVQQRGLKVINATWRNYGHNMAKTCWGAFLLDDVTSDITE